jgi:hypothetical protein
MTAVECLEWAKRSGVDYQRPINAFVDDFRRATPGERRTLVADPIRESGPMEGLVAAVVSALSRECALAAPAWTEGVSSPSPFFALPARSFAMRLRLMVEAPAPFRVRNVFVPEDYLSRA